VEENLFKFTDILELKKCPTVMIGDYCSKPYDCPLMDHCWKLPDHNVFELYRGGKKSFELYY